MITPNLQKFGSLYLVFLGNHHDDVELPTTFAFFHPLELLDHLSSLRRNMT